MAVAACTDEPDAAVLVEDPVLAEEATEPAAPIEPGVTARAPARMAPGVAVLAIETELECPTEAIFFETDAAALGPEDERKLDRVAACLKGDEETERVEITGRTDPRASEPYNEALSRRRARAVAEALRERGVADARFEIRAMGEQGVIEGAPILWPAQRHAIIDPEGAPDS
ncbi:MAG TPA: OmpA family protein [Sandaracinaceae bacterium LLY-WYZ-13_1]|nr:OmpA family protein [Sandaracinaceae bacterium LLY-WYZ-13_1]